MKMLKIALTVGVLSLIFLTGCEKENSVKNPIAASDETCKPEYIRSLPEGKVRDDLAEACMTRVNYKTPEPKTW